MTPPSQATVRNSKSRELDIPKCRAAYIRQPSSARLQMVGYNDAFVPDCRLPLCDLNNHVPVSVITCDAPLDKRVTEKVTVIVKTTQRLMETTRLIRTLHKYYPGLKVEVVDDEANITITKDSIVEQTKLALWERFVAGSNGTVHYTKLPGDAAISKGRNIALSLVRTEYFLLVDDDYVATNQTNLSKMVDVLERTDLTVVSGELVEPWHGRRIWSGIIRVHQRCNSCQIYEYPDVAYEEIPFFPSCYAVDYVLNLFLGRTEQILKVGGWDENLPVGEHRDFLLRLRKAGYKLAYCTDVVFRHRPRNLMLNFHTMRTFEKITKHYYGVKWNLPFHQFISCKKDEYLNHRSNASQT